MPKDQLLVPATELVTFNKQHFPNETKEYRAARNALLIEEIELRRQTERVAKMRRNLPPGGMIERDYNFIGAGGDIRFSELFGNKETLIVYSFMFGAEHQKPCPMCTSLMGTFDSKVADVEQRAALAFVGRGTFANIQSYKADRRWKNLKMYSDSEGFYTRDYVSREDENIAGLNVFTQRDGKIRHFWSSEMSGEMADPGQDPRGSPEVDALWALLDITPEGRGPDWYPKLEYRS